MDDQSQADVADDLEEDTQFLRQSTDDDVDVELGACEQIQDSPPISLACIWAEIV